MLILRLCSLLSPASPLSVAGKFRAVEDEEAAGSRRARQQSASLRLMGDVGYLGETARPVLEGTDHANESWRNAGMQKYHHLSSRIYTAQRTARDAWCQEGSGGVAVVVNPSMGAQCQKVYTHAGKPSLLGCSPLTSRCHSIMQDAAQASPPLRQHMVSARITISVVVVVTGDTRDCKHRRVVKQIAPIWEKGPGVSTSGADHHTSSCRLGKAAAPITHRAGSEKR
ncbi:unnamed protein product [Boreogadus saida]